LRAGAENEFRPRFSRLREQGEEIFSGSSRTHIGVHSLAVENTHSELKFWGCGENPGTATDPPSLQRSRQFPGKKLHGKGHSGGNFEVYLANLSSTYADRFMRFKRVAQERAKNYTLGMSLYTFAGTIPKVGRRSPRSGRTGPAIEFTFKIFLQTDESAANRPPESLFSALLRALLN
jgi:hypothetical protein